LLDILKPRHENSERLEESLKGPHSLFQLYHQENRMAHRQGSATLNGTPRKVARAETIRDRILTQTEKLAATKNRSKEFHECVHVLRNETDSDYFIDNEHTPVGLILFTLSQDNFRTVRNRGSHQNRWMANTKFLSSPSAYTDVKYTNHFSQST